MIPYDFHYQWPAGAYLILAAFFAFFLFGILYRMRQRLAFAKNMLCERSSTLYWIKAFLFCTALALCAMALMGPAGNGHYPEGTLPPDALTFKSSGPLQLKRKAHTVIFLLDVSASMAVTDSTLQKTRLEYAKEIADTIISGLNGEALALYTFTSKTLQQSPLTNDYIFLRLTLKEAQINEGGIPGTDLASALTEMQRLYYSPISTKADMLKLKTLILLTDGEDTAIEALPEAQRQAKEKEITNLVRGASENNLRVYTIGMGSTAGGVIPHVTNEGNPVHSHLNAALLQEIAKMGRGKYFEANRYSTPQLSKELLADLAKDPPYYEENQQEILSTLLHSLLGDSGLIYDRYVQLFIGLALACLGAALVLPDLFRKTSFLLLLISVLQTSLSSDSAEDIQQWRSEMQHAKTYAEAKMFDEARSIYENLLNLQLTEAQKGVLYYDIGTTYLYQHAWTNAINQLNAAALTKGTYPFFYRNVFRNLTLAYYESALEMQKENPEEAIKRLQLALKTGSQLPGGTKSALEKAIQVQLAQTRRLADRQKTADLTPLQNLQRLLDSVSDAQEQLHFLLNQPMSKDLAKNYSRLFAQELSQWLPLWQEQIEKADTTKTALKEAEEHYMQMIALLEKNAGSEALNQANASQEILLKLLEEMTQGSPFKTKLHQLLNAYERLLKTKKWKKERLKIVLELYSEIQNSQLSTQTESVQTSLKRSQEQLNEAIKAFEAGDLLLAPFLAFASEQQVRLALIQSPPLVSLDILNGLIQQQNYLLDLSAKSLKEADKKETSLTPAFLIEGQRALLPLCELYYQALYQEQVEGFRQGACQSTPWSQALPYFESGKLAAIQADQLLQKEKVNNLSTVIEFQNQAVENWQKVLAEIKDPSTQQTSCTVGNASRASPESTSANNDNDITTLLQMEQEDRSPPEPTQIQQNSVQRPW